MVKVRNNSSTDTTALTLHSTAVYKQLSLNVGYYSVIAVIDPAARIPEVFRRIASWQNYRIHIKFNSAAVSHFVCLR